MMPHLTSVINWAYILLISIIVSILPIHVCAARYYFHHPGLDNNLSQSSVMCIAQDSKGFMWFGTKDGLNRYDGSSFRIFRHDQSKPGSLGNNNISSLIENKDGRLWIGTDDGIYIYDPLKETFEPLKQKAQDGTEISNPIFQMTTDAQGNIWMAVESQGVFKFDAGRGALYHFAIPDSHLLSAIAVDTRNTVWVGYKGKGLYYADCKFHNFKLFKTQAGENPFADDHIFKILPDGPDKLYIGSSQGGLRCIDTEKGSLETMLPSADHPEDVFVRNILTVDSNTLWVATERGIYIYDLRSATAEHLSANDNDKYSLSDNAIYSIFRDRSGGMWIGSYFGGVDYIPSQTVTFEKYYPVAGENGLSGKVVREFCEDADGNIYIATENGGLNKFNPADKRFTHGILPNLHYNVHSLCIENNTLWVGTFSRGLYSLNLDNGQSRHYMMGHGENALNDNNIYSICNTSSCGLLVGTTTGLNRYNHATGDFTRLHNLDGVFVSSILEDHNGNIWLGTNNSGIFKYSPHDKSWKNYVADPAVPGSLPYNKVISISEDSKHRLWFSMLGYGFCSFDPATDTFKSYKIDNDIVYKVIESNDILWLTTNHGLLRYDLKDDSTKLYSIDNGLLSNQFNYSSGFMSNDGTIYFGCIGGFITFKPGEMSESSAFPPVVMTDFLIFNKNAGIETDNSPLDRSITYTDKITLKYNQNSFSFRFASLNYSAADDHPLRYKLKNFDKEWYEAPKSSLVTYTNLKPGDYTFCVKTANDKGEWSDEVISVEVTITPPLWLTPWAYIFYFLLAAGAAIGLYYRFRRDLQRKQQRQLELLETEKEKEIYHAKIDFFTNITHEIRTPLTLIHGPLQNILDNNDMGRKELFDNLTVMERNTHRLLDLTNQLLDFRKAEANNFRLNFVECNVSRLISDIAIRFKPMAEQAGLDFRLNMPLDDFIAPVDKETVTKILSNLFNNALKYSRSYIHVTLNLPADSDNRFSIKVCNDGDPIGAEMREQIFRPFVQLDNSTSRIRTGTGIGLPLARSLAELHNGRLYLADSDEICFTVELPVTQENAIILRKDSPDSTPILVNSTIKPQTPHVTILVVEDNHEMRDFICRLLERRYSVLQAANGNEALEIIENNPVSLVISDVMMPDMDGFELCKTLKSDIRLSHIPIILLTAKVTLQSKIEGIELGANDYIEKPFSTEYLLARVENLLTTQEKLRQAFTSSPFSNAKTMALSKADETFLDKLTEAIQESISDPDFNVNILADKMNMSRSSLHRKIKAITEITPNEFIQLQRLKMGARLIQSGEYRINEVCDLVGFNSSSYFAKCFQKQFGVLPKDFVKSTVAES